MESHVINHTQILIIAIVVIVILLVIFLRSRLKRRNSGGPASEQIYIGNLPYRTNEQDLRKRFSQFGEIIDVRVVKDRRTGRSKGYAFITFSDEKEAKKSLSAHGEELYGRSLVVHVAKPR